MPRKVYYGSYQSQRNRSNKKKAIIIILLIIVVVGFVAAVCVMSFNKDGFGLAMQSSVEEMTQMRIRIKELEDEIILLQEEIEGYKAELAQRPAVTAPPVQPPNETVAVMQATPEPTATPRPRVTRSPSIPTQPPVPVTPPPEQIEVQPTEPPVIPTQPPMPVEPTEQPPVQAEPVDEVVENPQV